MDIHTKIVCTIGPSVRSEEKMEALIAAGMNVARINFSHGTHEEHLETIQKLKRVREKTKQPLAIMLDTKGPEIRISKVMNGVIEIQPNLQLHLVRKWKKEGDIEIHPFEALETIPVGTKVLLDDGYLLAEVVKSATEKVTVAFKNKGILKQGKKVNVPGFALNLPALTEDDYLDLRFGCLNEIDIVAASFVRSAEHLESIKQFLSREGLPEALVVAKIESVQGVENFDSILEVSDGIMVARGDLGVEVDFALVPKLQKMMIRKCNQACKPVITATQMLESMIDNPRPTRAEASDVANAVYDGTSAVMLSAETSTGKYPIEAVQQMKRIIKEAEEDIDYWNYFLTWTKERISNDISSSVATAAVTTAYHVRAKAIFAYTSSGFTANLVSRLRPQVSILALTNNPKIFHQMAFIWGVVPLLTDKCDTTDESFSIMSRYALENHFVSFGDLVVITSGVPFGKRGTTNMMSVENIGQISVRGYKGYGPTVEGTVEILLSIKKAAPSIATGKILVIPHCDESFMPFMEKAAGVIVQNHPDDTNSEDFALGFAKTQGISVLVRAERAMSLLKPGEVVVLDPQRAIIYRKVMVP